MSHDALTARWVASSAYEDGCIGIVSLDLTTTLGFIVVAVATVQPTTIPGVIAPHMVGEVGTAKAEGGGVGLVVVVVPVATDTTIVPVTLPMAVAHSAVPIVVHVSIVIVVVIFIVVAIPIAVGADQLLF